jgi:hypothetical protein
MTSSEQQPSRQTVDARRLLVYSLVVSTALAVLLDVLLPNTTAGGDGEWYGQMARDPFDNEELFGPFPLRILVPLVVWLLPGPIDAGFHLLCWAGLVTGATAVTFLARAAGVDRTAYLCAPLYVLSFAGVYNVHQFRMVDAVTAGLCAVAILAAYQARRGVHAGAAALATAAKEIGITLPLAYYLARRGSGSHRSVLLETVLVSVPALATFLLIRLLIPHGEWDMLDHWRYGLSIERQYGFGKVFARAVIENFGMLWLLWPLALFLMPSRFLRLHLYGLVLLPLLAGGNWNRMPIYLLPLFLPAVLLVLERQSFARSAVAAAASAAVAVLLSLHNLEIRVTEGATANLALVPFAALAVVASLPAARAAWAEVWTRRAEPAPV